MTKKANKIIKLLLLATVSFTGSILVLVYIANIYIIQTKKDLTAIYSYWTLTETHYSPKYIYWEKSFCELNPNNCTLPEEHVTTAKVGIYNKFSENQKCERFLFLGDSFTAAPWVKDPDNWMNTFIYNYTKEFQKCAVIMVLATGGSGNDQQLARFADVVSVLKPDAVIWQYYWNDMYENITQEIFRVNNNTIKRTNAYYNPKFIVGYINQKLPLVRGSAFGRYVMHVAEAQHFTRLLSVDTNNSDNVIRYNSIKIPLLLQRMDELSTKHNFRYVLTVAPLECQSIREQTCDSDKEAMQNTLQYILYKAGKFISMENSRFSDASVLGAQSDNIEFFNNKEDANSVGDRHLTRAGNIYFGNIFAENYISLIKLTTGR